MAEINFLEKYQKATQRDYAVNPSRDCQHHCVTHTKNLAVFEALESAPDESVLDALDIDPDHGVFV